MKVPQKVAAMPIRTSALELACFLAFNQVEAHCVHACGWGAWVGYMVVLWVWERRGGA